LGISKKKKINSTQLFLFNISAILLVENINSYAL
jgi:hypothetical protein